MKAETIRRLLDYLPDRGQSLYARHNLMGCGPASDTTGNRIESSIWDNDVAVWLEAYRDESFVWRFIKHITRKKIGFPEFLPCDELGLLMRRAYRHESGMYMDHEILTATALTKSAMSWERDVVRALLTVRNLDVRATCHRIGISAQQVLNYERLFFNVLDRGEDALYLLPKVYPAGHASELFSGFAGTMDVGSMLRRCGYRNGLEELLYLIGHKEGSSFYERQIRDRQLPNQLEAMTMFNGLLLAKNGFAFQSSDHSPALSAARSMINAAKQGGQEKPDLETGADVASFGVALADEIKAFGNIVVERRSQLVQQRLIEAEERGRIAQAQ